LSLVVAVVVFWVGQVAQVVLELVLTCLLQREQTTQLLLAVEGRVQPQQALGEPTDLTHLLLVHQLLKIHLVLAQTHLRVTAAVVAVVIRLRC
jgi:hypothetical protein